MKTNKSYIIPCVNTIDLEGECLLEGSTPAPARSVMHEGYEEEETKSAPTITWSNSDAWQ